MEPTSDHYNQVLLSLLQKLIYYIPVSKFIVLKFEYTEIVNCSYKELSVKQKYFIK